MKMPELAACTQAVAAVLTLIAAVVAVRAAYRAPQLAAAFAEKLRQASALRELKLDCLRRVVGLRSQPPTADWMAALNEVAVTFNDEPNVLDSVVQMERAIRQGLGFRTEHLVDLIKAMMDHLGLDRRGIDDDFFLRPFAPNQGIQ